MGRAIPEGQRRESSAWRLKLPAHRSRREWNAGAMPSMTKNGFRKQLLADHVLRCRLVSLPSESFNTRVDHVSGVATTWLTPHPDHRRVGARWGNSAQAEASSTIGSTVREQISRAMTAKRCRSRFVRSDGQGCLRQRDQAIPRFGRFAKLAV